MLYFFSLPLLAQMREVPFTLDDRDRIMQTQVKVESMRNEMNTRFESRQRQITDVKTELSAVRQEIKDVKQEIVNLFYWGFGIMLSLMLFVLGFIIWDRRTAMEPVRERTQSLLQSLREYAKEQPKLADILRSHGLL